VVDKIRRQAKIGVTGGCFDFDPKIKNRKCLDFKKKIKNYQRLFFWDRLQKKTCFSWKGQPTRRYDRLVVRQDKKTSKDRSYWRLF
jgi:hypothetical protein